MNDLRISSGCLAVLAALVVTTLGCGPTEEGGPGGLCESDAECSAGERCDASVQLCVLEPLALTGESLKAFAGRPFNYPLTAKGGVGPYTWTARAIAPALGWVTLDAQGVLSGVPDAVAPQAAIEVVVKDAAGKTAEATFAIEVTPCTGDCVGECTPGAVCRGAQSACDVAEICTDQGSCPADEVVTGSVVCRPSAGPCDVAESCDGESPHCPEDARAAAGTECRGAGGPCDLAEHCDGTSPACPQDGFVAEGTLCRDAAGVCDVAEVCTGTSAHCPEDGKQPQGTPCRDAAPTCDVAEACDGVSDVCPTDGFQSAQTSCGTQSCSNGVYTPAPTCAGTAPVCQGKPTQSCGGYACNGASCRTACTAPAHCQATHYCGNNQCRLKKANGDPCSGPQAGDECSSGVCSARYFDADGDGYGVTTSVIHVCGTGFPTGYTANPGDCCDSDSRAHPGQTSQFTTPRSGCGGYDFNCDGQQTLTQIGMSSCKTQNFSPPVCPGLTAFLGWRDYVPLCGQQAPWVINCSAKNLPGGGQECQATVITNTQTCR